MRPGSAIERVLGAIILAFGALSLAGGMLATLLDEAPIVARVVMSVGLAVAGLLLAAIGWRLLSRRAS
jgi:hypothetical protein